MFVAAKRRTEISDRFPPEPRFRYPAYRSLAHSRVILTVLDQGVPYGRNPAGVEVLRGWGGERNLIADLATGRQTSQDSTAGWSGNHNGPGLLQQNHASGLHKCPGLHAAKVNP